MSINEKSDPNEDVKLKRIPKRFHKNATASDVLDGVDLSGKVFLITGGDSGIGYETARALALHNASVIIACRSVPKAATAIENITSEKIDAKVTFLYLDLADLQTVAECAEKFKASHRYLNCLILNAGVYNPLHRITDNEFEATFQINYLAHFYLTTLLLSQLKAASPSRVVVVAAEAHKGLGGRNLTPEKITWEHLSPTNKPTFNSPAYAYGLSKLCLILFSNEFNVRNSPDGITCNALHPGTVKTELTRNSQMLSSFYHLVAPFTKRADQGAATVVYCACDRDLENIGGRYFINCREADMSAIAANQENGELLYELSELMLQTYLEQKERTLRRASSSPATQEQQKVNCSSN